MSAARVCGDPANDWGREWELFIVDCKTAMIFCEIIEDVTKTYQEIVLLKIPEWSKAGRRIVITNDLEVVLVRGHLAVS